MTCGHSLMELLKATPTADNNQFFIPFSSFSSLPIPQG
jgi:hypothetical protein